MNNNKRNVVNNKRNVINSTNNANGLKSLKALKASNFTLNDLFKMTLSTNRAVAQFAKNQIQSTFYSKPLSGPEREQRMLLAKKQIGLANVNDVRLNNNLLHPTVRKAAKSTNLVGNEKYAITKNLQKKVIPAGVKLLPTSGSEPAFQKWLWGAEKKFIEANNCYAYACNQFRFHRDHKAQPGEKRKELSGNYNRVPLKCKDLTRAVLRDAGNGAYECSDPEKKCKVGFYKIMLVRAPPPGNEDFHFYRQDRDGTWSHKQGWGYGPTKLDASGKVIFDPRYANRNYGSLNYSVFCSAMCVPKQFEYNI